MGTTSIKGIALILVCACAVCLYIGGSTRDTNVLPNSHTSKANAYQKALIYNKLLVSRSFSLIFHFHTLPGPSRASNSSSKLSRASASGFLFFPEEKSVKTKIPYTS